MIVVVGPTGSGKSHLALAIAEKVRGEIVNCDSVQVYRHLNIGTAKVPPDERHGIPHHLLDLVGPDQVFSAGDYKQTARHVIAEIASRGSVPMVVGGTGFYLRALLNGLFEGPARDDALRARLANRPERLHRLSSRLDAPAAKRIHPNDHQKLIRAIEVCVLARRSITELFQRPVDPLRGFRILKIGLDPDRDTLTARLNERCIRMFESGLIEEVRCVLAMGFSENAKAFESIGYYEAVQYIAGRMSKTEAIEHMQISTRQYAKRQRTWFRREPGVNWLRGFGSDIQTNEEAIRLASEFISA
jgi:tRNA dimethylallyltransferase